MSRDTHTLEEARKIAKEKRREWTSAIIKNERNVGLRRQDWQDAEKEVTEIENFLPFGGRKP